MSEKLCVFCKYFNWRASESGTYGWSETATCTAGHSFNGNSYGQPESENDWREMLLTAETCKDYQRPE